MSNRKRKPRYRPPCFGERLNRNNPHSVAYRDLTGHKNMRECYCTICGGVFFQFLTDKQGKQLWAEMPKEGWPKPKYNRR